MRSYDEILADSAKGRAFSNGTEFHDWQSKWCENCEQPLEVAARERNEGTGCPLLGVALCEDRTPTEWVHVGGVVGYACIEFMK